MFTLKIGQFNTIQRNYIFVNRGHVDLGIKMRGFQAGSDKGDGGKAVVAAFFCLQFPFPAAIGYLAETLR